MARTYYDGDTFTRCGMTFKVEFPYDDTSDAPWERSDGHGPVSDWCSRDKRPGEWALHKDGSSSRYYDAQEAQAIALRDGWGLSEKDTEALGRRLGRTPSKREIAAESVRRDFEFLRGWCTDQWQYVGVVVTLLDSDGDETSEQESVWGIESNAEEYLAETAHELADGIAAEHRDAWRAALREARARRYWASRDIRTV